MTTNIGPHLLGRTVEHDPRSWAYRATLPPPGTPLRSVTWRNHAPILDQGNLGSCVGNTVSEWLNCAVAVNNRRRGMRNLDPRRPGVGYLDENNAVTLYSLATTLDDVDGRYPPDDTGTSGLGAGKALQNYHFIDGYDWTFSFADFLRALQRSPVCVGISWYTGMFDPDKAGYVEPSGSVEGGHEILARGVNIPAQYVLFRNHWTKDWGLGGECKMRFPVIEKLLSEQGDVMVPTVIGA